jgi:hypothetical protein
MWCTNRQRQSPTFLIVQNTWESLRQRNTDACQKPALAHQLCIDNMAQRPYYMDCIPYTLIYLEEFASWLDMQEKSLQLRTLAHMELLKERGPLLGRPYADTLKGSQITNLKELRIQHKTEPIRILFAFDPKQQAVIILGGSKQADKRWYDVNIPLAEKLFASHLERQRKVDEEIARKEQEK